MQVPTKRIATHPGTLLMAQITELGLTVHRVARDIELPATRLHEIVHLQRGVSAATAIARGRPKRPERAYMDILRSIQRAREVLTSLVH